VKVAHEDKHSYPIFITQPMKKVQ